MTSRYKNQMAPQNMLEIRGLSRGSVIENSRRNTTENSFEKGSQYAGLHRVSYDDQYDDDDESTLTGGSPRIESSPQSPVQSEDTITASGSGESSHYWSAGNSITTGNTTERSSVYSWGDDDFDHQASRMVRLMFQSIEKMLFESVLNESPYLQHECLEWMKAFPHLRILGKQTLPLREDGVYSLPPTAANSKVTTSNSSINFSYTESDGLSVAGNTVQVTNVPVHLLAQSLSMDSGSSKSVSGQGYIPPMGCDLSYLNEEIIEQDGVVDEYLAYDSRELDADEPTRRYHVPRRRRLGYPPITPNACVHDAVVNHLFDKTWTKLIKCITGGFQSKNNKTKNSILKILFDNHQRIRQMMQQETGQQIIYSTDNENYSPGFDFHYGTNQNIPGIHIERGVSSTALPHNLGPNFGNMIIGNSSRLLFHDGGLPPSRGSYFDHGLNSGRNFHNSPMRLSTAPHGGDMSALNDVMKISQKKLQLRSDKINIGNGLQNEDVHQLFSTSPNAGNNMYSSLSTHNIFNGRPTSPFGVGGRSSFIGRDYLSSGVNTAVGNRQTSATVRKGRIGIGRPARLMPLAVDRPKTPKQFTGMLKAKKLHLSSSQGNYDGPTGVVGVRVTSPQGAGNPPPTAPAASSNLWSTPSRLPPIHGLEAVHENMQTEFRRKNRMTHPRISSAVPDVESQQKKGFDGLNRPNTTHTFRTDVGMGMKRATSITPSNMSITNNAFGIIGGKNASPAPGFSYPSITGSSSMFQQHTSNSPENMAGLAGITGVGISMLGHSTNERDDDGAPWGHSYIRRKRTVVGT